MDADKFIYVLKTSTPEANYQVVFSYGQVADGSYQTILFIIYDFIPEQVSNRDKVV